MLVLWSCTPARCMYVAWDVRERPCLAKCSKCPNKKNLNPGQDTRRHKSTQTTRRHAHQRKTNQPTTDTLPATHDTHAPPLTHTRSAPELVGRQDPRLRELHRQLRPRLSPLRPLALHLPLAPDDRDGSCNTPCSCGSRLPPRCLQTPSCSSCGVHRPHVVSSALFRGRHLRVDRQHLRVIRTRGPHPK